MSASYGLWSANKRMNLNIMEPLAELDGFEPQTRARSNTWPLPRPENYVEPGEEAAANGKILVPSTPAAVPTAPAAKKNSSRRNAWGNLSYADLITQAITSSADKRLTLSQIYEWMVQNVPYFKDKGDSNSSAGWKNSIRHNLSLHNRFMRVQNEGTGKSSWWMINPDAKPGKSVRRRAASMETSKFEKRRGRVRKKIEQLRNGGTDATSSPGSSVSEGLDIFPDSPIHSGGFQLSPDFRPRASSNTSSGGRLSPIPAVVGVEPDWSSPTQFPSTNYSPEMPGTGNSPDHLAGTFEHGMKIQEAWGSYINDQPPQQPPPPYTAPYEFTRRDLSSLHTSPFGMSQCPLHRSQPCACLPVQCKVERMSPSDMSPSYPTSEPSPDPMSSPFVLHRNSIPRPPSNSPPHTPQSQTGTPSTMMGQLMDALNNSGLDDLNINIESLHGLDCNVDEVIRHELHMDGTLDFNFTGNQGIIPPPDVHVVTTATQASTASAAYTPAATNPSWVH